MKLFDKLYFAVTSHMAIQYFAVIVGLSIIITGLILGGPGLANEIASILGCIVILLGLLGIGQPKEGIKPIDEILRQLRSEVEIRLRQEVKNRQLLDKKFIALPVTGGVQDTENENVAKTLNGDASWSTEELQQICKCWFDSTPNQRLIICGDGGTGKTTIAILFALLIAQESQVLTPLPINLTSWQPDREGFNTWMERQIVRNYEACRFLRARKGLTRTEQLIYSGKLLLVIDGVDELAKASQSSALKEICESIPATMPFILLTRKIPSLRSSRLLNASMITIERLPAQRVADFLQANTPASAAPIISELRQKAGPLSSALDLPLFSDLARSAINEDRLNPKDLVVLNKAEEVRTMLIQSKIDSALRGSPVGQRRAIAYIGFLAKEMTTRGTHVFPWWRLADLINVKILITIVCLSIVPAYQLALHMPVGLTRGLAIGLVVGLGFGVLRGRIVRVRDLLSGGVCLTVSVLVIGWPEPHSPPQAIADATELTTAILTSLYYRQPLVTRGAAATAAPTSTMRIMRLTKVLRTGYTSHPLRWYEVVGLTLGIAIITSIFTTSISLMLDFKDPDRGPVSITIAALFGTGIATIAARLLIVSPDRPEPSSATLSLAKREGGISQYMQAGLISAVAIGVGGGLGGGMRFGISYGLMLVSVFGIVVGIPAGIVGGTIRWLSAPIKDASKWRPYSTLKTDRTIAIGCIVGITTAASIGISILIGPLAPIAEAIDHQSASFQISPSDSILFGLTMGIIAACFNTAWPTYLIANCWLAGRKKIPWRLITFLDHLHDEEILRREGPYYLFRHNEFQEYLARPERSILDPERPRTLDLYII